MFYSLLADLVLVSHALYIIFIGGGFILIVLGAGLDWRWVRNFWFRILHVAAIGIVVLQSWMEVFCPLTTLEMSLRVKAGQPVYHESFVAHWLHRLLFYEAPFLLFTICYTLFALAVVLAWFIVPPKSSRNRSGRKNILKQRK